MVSPRVLLADAQGIFLEGLRHLLVSRGFRVVGTATDGLEALAKARALRPEVILMDVQMPRCDGLETARLIMAEMPEIKIVMLAVSEDDETLFEAIRCGAFGFLLKQADAAEFMDSLAMLSRGEPPLSRGMAAKILREFARQGQSGGKAAQAAGSEIEGLNPKQVAVLVLVGQGLSYREIGNNLCITERTVKYHMRRIQEQLGTDNRAQVIARACRMGLVKDDGSESWDCPRGKRLAG